MATINSIGTAGRDYSTLQSWFDAIPSTPTGGYIGQCYNDSEFTGRIKFSGRTTSATNYIKLTTGPGQSFLDNAGASTLPLKYDRTKGVGLKTYGYLSTDNSPLNISLNYVTVEKIQVNYSGGDNYNPRVCYVTNLSGSSTLVQNCIFAKTSASSSAIAEVTAAGNIVNCVLYDTVGGATSVGIAVVTGSKFRSCTIINASGSVNGTAVSVSYTSNIIQDCLFLGWGSWKTGTGTFTTEDYNATDLSTGPTGAHDLLSLVAANQVINPLSDFRPKAGNSLQAGIRDQTYTNDLDIIGQPRSTTKPTIGAREYISLSSGNWVMFF